MSIDRLNVSALILLSALSVTSANAKTHQAEKAEIRVTYGDLDLSSRAGPQTLQRRVQEAIDAACTRPHMSWNDSLNERNCVTKASAEAQPQVALALRNAKQSYAMNDKSASIIIH